MVRKLINDVTALHVAMEQLSMKQGEPLPAPVELKGEKKPEPSIGTNVKKGFLPYSGHNRLIR